MMDREEAPITLEEACRLYPGSRMTPAVLRYAASQGKLLVFHLGRRAHTTPAEMNAWVKRCQDAARRHASTSIEPATSGLSETEQATIAQDAVAQIVEKLKKSSPPTSPRNTRRDPGTTH